MRSHLSCSAAPTGADAHERLLLAPQETADFVAYVAKGQRNARACYVLECDEGLAQDVITTIGQAFELRFKEFLKRAPRNLSER